MLWASHHFKSFHAILGLVPSKVTFTKVSGYGEAYPGRSRDTVSCSTA